MTISARVFMSGMSQVLRWPAKLRLLAQEVRLGQIGNDIGLHPEVSQDKDMGRWLQQFYASSEALPADFLAERTDAPAQERDWS
ncbi:MAG: antitoxin [Limnohabitans sp.]